MDILLILKELYLTMFTIGYRFRIGGGWGPEIDAGKGVALICVAALFVLKGIETYIEVYFSTKFDFDSHLWEQAVITFALYFPNYYILVTHNYGIAFEREFAHYEKRRKIFLLMGSIILLLAIIAFSICSDFVYRRHFGTAS